MPVCVANYPWGKLLAGCGTVEAFEKSLKKQVRMMDESEFDLFLAGIVMESARKQIMGVDLTAQVELLRGLRK